MITLKDISKLIRSINNNDIKKIKIEKHHTKIIINKIKNEKPNIEINKKNYSTIANYQNNKYIEHANNTSSKDKQNNNISESLKLNQQVDENLAEKSIIYSTIISPMVGTFYRSPAPNEMPFIEINDLVNPKQIVCIIEAMKLMNEIEAEVQGEIVEILVKDGDIVDCGQALMKVKIK
uniref:Biotin carboxyl carrier protein of acetyl-CoA carboxylase n=1 Tax=Osmundaria fimbriata TaxID=228265 RepID=A0A1Z1M4M7_OSMFI|nr:acetyl-CoA carboxylase biotin carboxyl carrier protein [Osmundaria fimbriata]ARW60860.1 acetyl-CoA carboxylase biotin carboxyl carrier protein [Osmundaria fimbriata]